MLIPSFRSATLSCATSLLILAASGSAASRPNVLLIAVDDLRPELACYGADHVSSPNIDRFAATGHGSGELRRHTDQPNRGENPMERQRRVRQAYYACVSYIDAQIGRVLDELDRLGLANSTIVSLYGDHGYHLGEQGRWGKTTNFELDTRVPLILRVPGMKAVGTSSASLVELVDLYPTLADLAGLPVADELEGKSLSAMLDDPTASVKDVALSQYPRGGGLMGYSMRTQTHRLTQWVHRASGEVRASELYDYREGVVETKNIALESPALLQSLASKFVQVAPTNFSPIATAIENHIKVGGTSVLGSKGDKAGQTSFEAAGAGSFQSLTTEIGTWTASFGKAVVDDEHAKTGKHCLHLPGDKSVVELEVADTVGTDGQLTFVAERWTTRSPFSFRIEKQTAGKWAEIFNGDKQVRVGRAFLSSVKVPLGDSNIRRLRFSVTSPANTGVLIDDVRIAPTLPQKTFAFSRVFGDHMVLQADQPIRVWGGAEAGSKLEVVLKKDRSEKVVQTIAGPSGRWIVELPPESHSSEPYVLVARSEGKTETIHDVLIGEVWLCAGQSNMEWPLANSTAGSATIRDSSDRQFRLMNFAGAARGGSGVYDEALTSRLEPERFSTGAWQVSGPSSASNFSAVGYYFGKQLRQQLDCPVGMINVAIGGTPIESWVSANALSQHPQLSCLLHGNWLDNPDLDTWCQTRARENLQRGLNGEFTMPSDAVGPNHSFKPGFMHQAGIEPFTPMSIRGALWYQGESNADTPARTKTYDACFPLLVDGWRHAFQNENMPVAFVQLPAMGRPNWPVFREYQRRSLDRLENVGMAITIDTGDANNVHPGDKQPVGDRLAQWALVNTYGKPGIAMGPLLRTKQTMPGSLILSFDHVGDGLKTTDAKSPNQFEVAGSDGVYQPATVKVSGAQLTLTSHRVAQPRSARYAWQANPNPRPNLVNSAGLPASPFCTEETIPDEEPAQ